MSFLQIQENTTGLIIPVYLQDSNGAGVSGVAAGTVTLAYKRQNSATATVVGTVNAATQGTYSGSATAAAWAASTNMSAGNYELHLPNNALATGVDWVIIEVGATGARTERFLIEIGPFDISLPDNFPVLGIDGVGRIDVGLIEGVQASTQITNSVPTAEEISAQTWIDQTPVDLNPSQSGVTIGTVTNVTNTVNANVVQLNSSASAVLKQVAGLAAMITDNLTTGGTNNIRCTTLPAIAISSLVGRTLVMITGPATLQARRITAYDEITDIITLASNFSVSTNVGDTFIIF